MFRLETKLLHWKRGFEIVSLPTGSLLNICKLHRHLCSFTFDAISDIALIIAWNLVKFISITDLEARPCADNQ